MAENSGMIFTFMWNLESLCIHNLTYTILLVGHGQGLVHSTCLTWGFLNTLTSCTCTCLLPAFLSTCLIYLLNILIIVIIIIIIIIITTTTFIVNIIFIISIISKIFIKSSLRFLWGKLTIWFCVFQFLHLS